MNKVKIGNLLNQNKLVKVMELLLVFSAALGLITTALPHAGDNLVKKQMIIWFANILMLVIIWAGMRLRGQKLKEFGLTFGRFDFRKGLRTFLLSLLVFVCATGGFVLGSILMANITGIPQQADMSNYNYLQNNIPMFLLTLFGVYIVASFGEEVIYRAFLINRMMELGLDNRTGKITAVIISAVIFGLVHYEWGPMGIVQTGFMGLVLGFFYLRLNKRLWPLILAHGYMDTILMVQLYLSNQQ